MQAGTYPRWETELIRKGAYRRRQAQCGRQNAVQEGSRKMCALVVVVAAQVKSAVVVAEAENSPQVTQRGHGRQAAVERRWQAVQVVCVCRNQQLG